MAEKLLLEVLGAPADVTGFSLLFVVSEVVLGEAYLQELSLELLNQVLSFEVGAIFVGLHGQIDQVSLSCSLVLCQLFHGLG